MDPATLLGLVIAFVAIFAANILEGGSPGAMFLFPPMLLVFGGTIGVGLAGGLMRDATGAMAAVKNAFAGKAPAPDESVGTLVSLAEQARRNGLLALEEQARGLDDPFLRQGVELLVDGTDPHELRDILESKVYAKRTSDKSSAKFFADMGGYAPTIGIIGTVLSLVHVLENLDQPEKLGHMIGAAFLATLWGVMSANCIFLPLANKLKRLSEVECRQQELLIEGLMAIQAGSNPRTIEQKLRALMPPHVAPPAPPAPEKQAA